MQRSPRTVWLGVTMVAAILATAAIAAEQPLYEIELKTDPDFPGGKVAMVQGIAGVAGDRFQFPETDIMQPVSVSVFTKNEGDQVRLRVGKDSWNEPDREGTTAADRRVDFKFRTQGGFRLWVTAEHETPYQLFVWIGDEIVLPPPPVAVPMSQYRQHLPQEKARQWPVVGGIIATGLALGIGIWMILRHRRKLSGRSP